MYPSPQAVVHIVDDDVSIRTALQRLLQASERSVITFESVDQLLSSTTSKADGCLVMDVHLGDVNSIELVGSMREAGYENPIVFITGYGDVQTGISAMKLGAVDYLLKPVEATTIINAVNRAILAGSNTRQHRTEQRILEDRLGRLTPRERQVFELVVTGLLNKQIATRLGTCEKTVKVHRGRVMEKMEVYSLAQLVHIADRLGINNDEL